MGHGVLCSTIRSSLALWTSPKVLFIAAVIDQHDIITTLQETGYLSDNHAAAQGRTSLTSMIMQSVIELALERLVLRLI